MLTEIEEVADGLATRLREKGPKAVFQLEGLAGTGKSACLASLAERLREQTDLSPILIAPPSHHLDVGPVALTDVATGLAEQQLINGQLEGWTKGDAVGRWSDRVGDIHDWVSAHADSVVLLLDDPKSWGANRDEDDFFPHRGFDASLALTTLHCRRVIAGEMPFPYVHPEDTAQLRPPVTDPAWLEPPNDWGQLAPAALELAGSDLLDRPLTPLQVRLLIAAIALSSVAKVARWFASDVDPRRGRVATRQMVTRVGELLRAQQHVRVWETWIRLSVTRRAFDEEILDALIPAAASNFERDLIRHCLLFGEDSIQMHDDVKRFAQRWRFENRNKKAVKGLVSRTTRKLFSIHSERFARAQAKQAPQALQESIEAYHFAAASGDSRLFREVQPIFVEQLDALGWSLSYEHRQFKQAAKVFEQALEWDPDDDYAHHYLAYNLDRVGVRVSDVESHYRRAADLDPRHPWWRSRLVVFLINRGRISEAREEWENALIDLGVDDGESSVGLYKHLHYWVAGALLDGGEPGFAREVLDDVPQRARTETYEGLYQRAEALLQLGEGDAVIPAWRLRPNWWREGPERLQFRFNTDERLVRWLAARVERKDKDGLHIRAAELQEGEEPSMVWTVISNEDFARWCQDKVKVSDITAGAFIEVGLYHDPGDQDGEDEKLQTVIRVLSSREWKTPGLSQLRSDRYLVDHAPRRTAAGLAACRC